MRKKAPGKAYKEKEAAKKEHKLVKKDGRKK